MACTSQASHLRWLTYGTRHDYSRLLDARFVLDAIDRRVARRRRWRGAKTDAMYQANRKSSWTNKHLARATPKIDYIPISHVAGTRVIIDATVTHLGGGEADFVRIYKLKVEKNSVLTVCINKLYPQFFFAI